MSAKLSYLVRPISRQQPVGRINTRGQWAMAFFPSEKEAERWIEDRGRQPEWHRHFEIITIKWDYYHKQDDPDYKEKRSHKEDDERMAHDVHDSKR